MRIDSPGNLGQSIWNENPKPFSALFKGVGQGGLAGAVTGGMLGGLPGAAAGAALGSLFGALTSSLKATTSQLDRLQQVMGPLLERYKEVNPIISQIKSQWDLLQRRIDTAWARTIAPVLKQLSTVEREFTERWNKMKMGFFEAIQPYLMATLRFLQVKMRVVMSVLEAFSKIMTTIIDQLTKVLQFFNLLPEVKEKSKLQSLTTQALPWPTVEGALTGAMKTSSTLTGPPFTTERGSKAEQESSTDTKSKSLIDQLYDAQGKKRPLATYQPIVGAILEYMLKREVNKRKQAKQAEDAEANKSKESSINLTMPVNNSQELSAVFEKLYNQTSTELRRIEADIKLQTLRLQEVGAYT